MSSCNSCGKNNKCGCKDQGFTTIPTFQCLPNTVCPNPEVCSEFFDANCVFYSGYGIVDLDIVTGDRLNSIIQKLVLLTTNPDCIGSATCNSIDTLSIYQVTQTTIIPQWSLVSTGTGYQVEYKLATAGSFTLLPLQDSTATQNTITNLLADTEYHIRVNTFCSVGSCYSVTLLVKTLS